MIKINLWVSQELKFFFKQLISSSGSNRKSRSNGETFCGLFLLDFSNGVQIVKIQCVVQGVRAHVVEHLSKGVCAHIARTPNK